MKNVYYIMISIIIFMSCQKEGTYECVCYPYSDPNDYVKYTVQNYKSNAYTYCKMLSNDNQNCFITE
jgi:hypothetical protein